MVAAFINGYAAGKLEIPKEDEAELGGIEAAHDSHMVRGWDERATVTSQRVRPDDAIRRPHPRCDRSVSGEGNGILRLSRFEPLMGQFTFLASDF
jgi:hypothetical protein